MSAIATGRAQSLAGHRAPSRARLPALARARVHDGALDMMNRLQNPVALTVSCTGLVAGSQASYSGLSSVLAEGTGEMRL
jgi:hypothetical protein